MASSQRNSKRPRPQPLSSEGSRPSGHNVKLSKTLSWLLRHHLELAFKHLSSEDVEGEIAEAKATGYVDVAAVLSLQKFRGFSLEDITKVVEQNDKQRFSLRQRPGHPGVTQIRANQGHTIKGIDPELTPLSEASTDIIHGTYLKKWALIKSSGGLSRMQRNHIHFSKGLPGDGEGKVISGMRGDCDVVIYVDFEKAKQAGFEFFESANGVILCPGDEGGILPMQYFKKVVHRHSGLPID